jgi:hypothetical protein
VTFPLFTAGSTVFVIYFGLMEAHHRDAAARLELHLYLLSFVAVDDNVL